MAGLFIGFLVEKCAACQSNRKSDLLASPLPDVLEGLKSQAILAVLDCVQKLHLDW